MNELRLRLANHLSGIRLGKRTSVAEHFNRHTEPLSDIFRITPIMLVSDDKHRAFLEMKFINTWNTLVPHGLNERFDKYNSDDRLLPIIVPYSNSGHLCATKLKNLAKEHDVTNSRVITAFTRSKNLGEILK